MRKLLFLLALCCFQTIFAATITSNVVTGNWNSAASWVGGIIPGPADRAVVVSGAVITLNVNASITELQINTGGTFNCSSNTLTLTGDFSNNGTFNSQTGTVHFNGFSLSQSIFGTSITTFNNIINDNTNGAAGMGVSAHQVETRIKGNFVQNGVFNRNSTSFPSATIRFTGNTFITGTTSLIMNHVVIDAGATLHAATGTFPQSSSTYIAGDYTNNGTLDPGTGTVYFQFSNSFGNNQNINAGASAFYNLTVNKTSGVVTVFSNITVANDFTIAAGSWSAGTFNLNVAGDFSNSGTFTSGTGLVLLNGSTNQNMNAGTSSLYNFTVNKSAGDVYLLSNVTATNNLSLTSRNIYTTNSFEIYASNSNPATSLTGGSSASFVIGRLRRAVTATANTYSYPIGPMHVTPVKYRPVVLQQTSSGGASNISMIGDTIGNATSKKANWYVRIGSNAGTPTGTLQFRYNLSTDFQAGMQECLINAQRGTMPPPASWNFVLNTTVAPSGGINGTITSAIPATLSPNSFILGEPTPAAASTTICSGNTAALSVSSPSGNVQYDWYSASTGGTLLQGNSASYTTPVLNSTAVYYVEYFNSLTSCSSARTPVTVNVNQTPVASFVTGDSICTGGNHTVTFNGTAGGSAIYTWNFNGASVTSGSGAGPYSINWATTGTKNITLSISENSCVSNTASMPVLVGNPPTSAFNVNATSCQADTLSVTYTGVASTNAGYNWSFGGATIISGSGQGPFLIHYPTPGTKSVSLTTDDYNCTSTTTQNITINPTPTSPTVNTTATTICQGDSATITASGSTGGTITYTFYDQATGGTNLGSSPVTVYPTGNTTYYLEVTNTDGCLSSSTRTPVTINVNPTPTPATISITNDTICQGDATTLSASGSTGGTISYNFYDQSAGGTLIGQSPVTVTPTVTTTYFLEVINTDNCLSSSTRTPVTITVNPTPSGTAVSASNDTICQGASTVLTASGATGGSITYDFYDQASGGTLLGASPLTVSPNATTTYYLETGNTNGCTSSSGRTPVTVTVNPTPGPATISVSNDTLCQGETTIITATGSTGGTITYNFYDQPSGGMIAGTSPFSVTPSSTTTYYLEVVNNYGCVSSTVRDSVKITVHPTPTPATITVSNDTLCAGDTVMITANGSTGGSISYIFYDQSAGGNNLGNAPLVVAPSVTTTYYLEVMNTDGCKSSQTREPVTITVNPAPTPATISVTNDSICSGSSTTLSASGSTGGTISYNFYDQAAGGTMIGASPLNVSPSATSSYYLEVINSDGCKSDTMRTEVEIVVHPTPTAATITTTSDTICQGDAVTLEANSSTGGQVTYTFYDQATGGTSAGTSPVTVSPSVTTTYYLEVSNEFFCLSDSVRTQVTIVVNPTPTAATVSITNDTICSGDTTLITASGSTGGTISYNFYDQSTGGTYIGTSPLSVSPSTTTTYYLEIINAEGCLSSSTRTPVTITVNSLPLPATVTVTDDTLCQGDQTIIDATGTSSQTSYNFYDSSVGGTLIGPAPITVSPGSTTTYYLEVTNVYGCTSSSSRTPVIITVHSSAQNAQVTGATICSGNTALLTATAGSDSVFWYEDPSMQTQLGSGKSFTTDTLQFTTTFYAQAMTPQGCVSPGGSTPVTVTVNPTPEVTLTVDPPGNIVTGQLVTITATPAGYTFYDFMVNNSSMQSGSSNVYESYTLLNGDVITISVTDGDCIQNINDSLALEIKPLPNAFTPNGDGKNDRFIKGLDVTILNRWGQQLYQGTDGWDGTYQGKPVTPGTYYYTIRLRENDGSEKIVQGPLTLIAE